MICLLPQDLAFARDSFSSRPLYKNQCYYSQTPTSCGSPLPPHHRLHCCAIQCFPPTILNCNTCHTILRMAISCEGQHRTPPPKTAADTTHSAHSQNCDTHRTTTRRVEDKSPQTRRPTILPLPILYGVWHTKGGRGGVVYCTIDVRRYCNIAGDAGGRGQ